MKKVIYLSSVLALAGSVFFTSCKKDAKAGFTATPATAKIGEAISFKDKESDRKNASFVYDFGDGSMSTDRNPSHIYTKAGTYHVYQTVSIGANAEKGKGFSQVATSDVVITDPFVAPMADFTATPGTVAKNEPVTFANTSTNASWFRWSWVSSNGQSWMGSYSEVRDLVQAFSNPGTYTVTLLADIVDPNMSGISSSTPKSTSSVKVMTVTVTGTANTTNAAVKGMLTKRWTFSSDAYTTSGWATSPVGYSWMTSAQYNGLVPNPFLHTAITFNEDGTYYLLDPLGYQSVTSSGNWSVNTAGTWITLTGANSNGSLAGLFSGSPSTIFNEIMMGGTYELTTLSAGSLVMTMKEIAATSTAESRTRTLTCVYP